MRCPACKQYVPDGLGLKTCPSCNAELTIAPVSEIASTVQIATPIIPEAKLLPPSDETPKLASKLDVLSPDEIKKKRESLGFILGACLIYAIAFKFIYGSEYFRTLSMAGLKILAYTTFFKEFFILKVIGLIIYLRALWVVGSCAQQLIKFNRIKLSTGGWVFLQMISPLFFAKFGMAIIPFYFLFEFEKLVNANVLNQKGGQFNYSYQRKSEAEVNSDQMKAIIGLVGAIVLAAGLFLIMMKVELPHRKATQPKDVYYYMKDKQYAEAVDILSKDKNLSHSEYHYFVQAYEGLEQWANAFGMQVALMQALKENAGPRNYLLFKLFELQGKKDSSVLELSTKERFGLLAKLFQVDDESMVLEKNKLIYAKWEVSRAFLETGEYFHRNMRFEIAERFYKQGLDALEKSKGLIKNAFYSEVGIRESLIDVYILQEDYKAAIIELSRIIDLYKIESKDGEKSKSVQIFMSLLEMFKFADEHSLTLDEFNKVFDTVLFYVLRDSAADVVKGKREPFNWRERYDSLKRA